MYGLEALENSMWRSQTGRQPHYLRNGWIRGLARSKWWDGKEQDTAFWIVAEKKKSSQSTDYRSISNGMRFTQTHTNGSYKPTFWIRSAETYWKELADKIWATKTLAKKKSGSRKTLKPVISLSSMSKHQKKIRCNLDWDWSKKFQLVKKARSTFNGWAISKCKKANRSCLVGKIQRKWSITRAPHSIRATKA